MVLYYINPGNPEFQQPQMGRLFKTMWERKKFLVASISAFSYNVFYLITERRHHLSLGYKLKKTLNLIKYKNLLFLEDISLVTVNTWHYVIKASSSTVCGIQLTLSSIYTHFNTLKKKASRKHCGKRWNCSQ